MHHLQVNLFGLAGKSLQALRALPRLPNFSLKRIPIVRLNFWLVTSSWSKYQSSA